MSATPAASSRTPHTTARALQATEGVALRPGLGVPPLGRIPVVDVAPVIEAGRWPTKATVGELVPIEATVFREGHDHFGATAVLVDPDGNDAASARMTDVAPGLDRYRAVVVPTSEGLWGLRVEGWSDPWSTWKHTAEVKLNALMDVDLVIAEGAQILARAAAEPERDEQDRALLRRHATNAARTDWKPATRLRYLQDPLVDELFRVAPLRELVSPSPTYPLLVERPLALASSWYEIFVRSQGATYDPVTGRWRSGTLATASRRLPAIAEMGFDVVYLTPIHPIGLTFRKGRNNTLTAEPGDPGSPYAIGSPDGGHDAIHPDLGTFDDFDDFVSAAHGLGLEVALDLALQCSPDHPWVTEHPEWFTHRPDGTIAYAENPPKKYQDIYPLNFDNDPDGIYEAIRQVVATWIDHGVTLFRVDNPHTKPLSFWERLLGEVRSTHPEIIFLSEAFTRPAMMHTLAKIGFQQSYTYFTWRNTKTEIEEYLTEVSGPAGAYMRPNFWPTTHDILPPALQQGGVAGFALRAVLAATGSPSWGIYEGYELVENVPRPGVEEQIDNEKYEFKPRNWQLASHFGIGLLLGTLNRIRREHPAMRQLRNLTIHPTSDDSVIAYSRRIPAEHSPTGQDDTVLTVVSLDPHRMRSAVLYLDMAALGLSRDATFEAHDELSGSTYEWGAVPYVELDPALRVAHVIHVRQRP